VFRKSTLFYVEKNMQLEKLAEKIISGYVLTKDEALELYKAPIDVLKESASKITKHFF
jgi:biotin synthase